MLDELFGDADRAEVLERMTAGFDEQVARYRHLLSVVNRQPAPPARRGLRLGGHCTRARAGR